MLVLVLQALSPTFNNQSRPIIGSQSIVSSSSVDVLFRNRPELQMSFERVASEVAALHPTQVGLIFGGDSWEFPLWYLLRRHLKGSNMPTIIHEMNEQAIDPHSDVIVYLDVTSPAAPKGMIELPAFVRCGSTNGYHSHCNLPACERTRTSRENRARFLQVDTRLFV